MKQRTPNIRTVINIVLVITALWIIFSPGIMSAVMTKNADIAGHALRSLRMFGPAVGLFLINYLFLCPRCLYTKGRKKWFYIVNAVLIIGWRAYMIHRTLNIPLPPNMPHEIDPKILSQMRFSLFYDSLMKAFMNCVVVSIAAGICYIINSAELKYQYEVQKRNAAEAELSWLKNQLNPHFLFNTLNNISSLAAIDGDKAQDSIAQLSDLLRYVLYESDKDFVPLDKEISFMNDYIDLMRLRYSGKADVRVTMDIHSGKAGIAPLLFISLIENAFKHGVSSRAESFVDISMKADGSDLVFECANSLFEKPKTDMAGSGIGIQNMHKRLDLIYPGQYEFNYGPQDGLYRSVLRIKNLF